VESVLGQRPRPAQVLLVMGHNTDLALERVANSPECRFWRALVLPGCQAHPTLDSERLLRSSRPSSKTTPRPGWLASLVKPYSRPEVVATGGTVRPRWPGLRPPWLLSAFGWAAALLVAGWLVNCRIL
jgi:hypothetical protein